MTHADQDAARDLINAVTRYAATPRVTPAYLSLVHDGQVLVSGWLPGTATPAPADAAQGQRTVPLGRPRDRTYAIGWPSLTDAELRVVRLVVTGLTNRQIAARLCLSRHTVNAHLRHVLHKLDLHSRVDLTRVALQHDPGLAQPAEPAADRQAG